MPMQTNTFSFLKAKQNELSKMYINLCSTNRLSSKPKFTVFYIAGIGNEINCIETVFFHYSFFI